MSVRYKFKSEASLSQILFDGIEISVGDVKKEIFRVRKLGQKESIDLMISNTQTGEKYTEEDKLIPKNTTLTIIRVPVIQNNNNRRYFGNKNIQQNHSNSQVQPNVDLSTMKATEEEKIMAMMMQSTADYKSTNFTAKPPSNYLCRKCHVSGHFIRNCPFSTIKTNRYDPSERKENKRMTGIPMSMRFQQPQNQQPEVVKIEVKAFEIPQNLCCSMCKDIYRNPVKTPCCELKGCRECIVKCLTESDEYECPKCEQKYIFPSELKNDDDVKNEVEKLTANGRTLRSSIAVSV